MLTDGATFGRVKVGVWVVAERRGEAFDGSSKVENSLQERTSITVPLLTLDVKLTDRFGLQAGMSVPDVTRTAVVPRPTGSLNFSETFSGLGDTSVIAWYRLKRFHGWNTTLNFGSSIPTGKTETPRFRPELRDGNLVPMSRLQRGSGTFDPLVGLNLDRRIPQFTVFASVAARTPLYQNNNGLRTGAAWEVSGGVAKDVFTHRITALGRLGWLHRQQDVFRATPVLVGGGDWLYWTPGVAAQIGQGVHIQAEIKIPIYRWLRNIQLDAPAIFQIGISREF